MLFTLHWHAVSSPRAAHRISLPVDWWYFVFYFRELLFRFPAMLRCAACRRLPVGAKSFTHAIYALSRQSTILRARYALPRVDASACKHAAALRTSCDVGASAPAPGKSASVATLLQFLCWRYASFTSAVNARGDALWGAIEALYDAIDAQNAIRVDDDGLAPAAMRLEEFAAHMRRYAAPSRRASITILVLRMPLQEYRANDPDVAELPLPRWERSARSSHMTARAAFARVLSRRCLRATFPAPMRISIRRYCFCCFTLCLFNMRFAHIIRPVTHIYDMLRYLPSVAADASACHFLLITTLPAHAMFRFLLLYDAFDIATFYVAFAMPRRRLPYHVFDYRCRATVATRAAQFTSLLYVIFRAACHVYLLIEITFLPSCHCECANSGFRVSSFLHVLRYSPPPYSRRHAHHIDISPLEAPYWCLAAISPRPFDYWSIFLFAAVIALFYLFH